MNVESRLQTVTIYREGAVCTRRAKVEATGREVRVVGLPLSLVAGSVRGKIVTGPIGLRVTDVRPAFDVVFGDQLDESAEVKAKDAAKAEVARLEAIFSRIDGEVRELHGLKPVPFAPKEGDPPRAAPVEATLALTAFVDQRLTQLLEDKRRAERELSDAKEALRLRERRLAEASSERRTSKAKVTRAIVLTFSMEAPGPIELEVEYQVPGVRWAPTYALRLERGFGGGRLRMRASIVQDTGEDWKGVALSLSTATLLRRTDAPELKSLRIGRSQPEPPKPGFRAPPPGLDELFDGYDSVRPLAAAPKTPVAVPAVTMMDAKPKTRKAKAIERPEPEPEADDEDGFAEELAATEFKRSRRGAPGNAPPPPPMAAAPARSVSMSMAAPAQGMPRPAAKGGGFGGLVAGAVDLLSSSDESADLDEGGAFFDEEVTGASFAMPEPRYTPAEDLLDYDRLRMPGPAVPGLRGKLATASELELAFVAGVSVQVDVVLALVQTFQQRAVALSRLALPPRCVPVSSFDQFDFRYDSAAPVDVPSTGTWTTVSVMECQVGLTPQYVCVPSVEPKVYRTLAIANATTAALLAGPVEVSVGDEFLMTTAMPAIPPGANTERLGLGVEEAIKVARKTNFAETTGGFLGGSTVLKHELSIELNNRLASPAAIEVRERVPQAPINEKDIKVEEAEVKPAWEKVEGPLDGQVAQGVRRWRLTVPAGARTTLSAQFLVRIPADKMLVGGNRRS